MHISSTWGYLVLILVGICLDIYARGSAGRLASFTELLRYATHRSVSHAAMIMIWVWLGYHFLIAN